MKPNRAVRVIRTYGQTPLLHVTGPGVPDMQPQRGSQPAGGITQKTPALEHEHIHGTVPTRSHHHIHPVRQVLSQRNSIARAPGGRRLHGESRLFKIALYFLSRTAAPTAGRGVEDQTCPHEVPAPAAGSSGRKRRKAADCRPSGAPPRDTYSLYPTFRARAAAEPKSRPTSSGVWASDPKVMGTPFFAKTCNTSGAGYISPTGLRKPAVLTSTTMPLERRRVARILVSSLSEDWALYPNFLTRSRCPRMSNSPVSAASPSSSK